MTLGQSVPRLSFHGLQAADKKFHKPSHSDSENISFPLVLLGAGPGALRGEEGITPLWAHRVRGLVSIGTAIRPAVINDLS